MSLEKHIIWKKCTDREHLMSNVVLFIFEGVKTEQNITDNLIKYFIKDDSSSLVRASFGFNIYELYKKLHEDEGLDLYGIIVEELKKRQKQTKFDKEVININDPEQISDIFLFFDYDCHCHNADDKKLERMLAIFNNSQENGLLHISYPMVESIRHQRGVEFTSELHSTKDLVNYKSWINQQADSGNLSDRYYNWGAYTLPVWSEIVTTHLMRANHLVACNASIPPVPLQPLDIFSSQKQKYIPDEKVAVINAFPCMLHEFYGEQLVQKLIASKSDSPHLATLQGE